MSVFLNRTVMRSNTGGSRAFSLVEIVAAVLVLAVALIPLGALITADSTNTIIVENAEFAGQYGRQILDTMLEQVDFDELLQGSPAILTGSSAKNFGSLLFPGNTESSGQQLCEGDKTNKSCKFHAKLEVYEMPDELISFTSFRTPDVLPLWYTQEQGAVSLKDLSEETEKKGTPSYMQVHDSVFRSSEWASTSETYSTSDFRQDLKITSFMKVLILKIEWQNRKRDKKSELYLVTHKARLKRL